MNLSPSLFITSEPFYLSILKYVIFDKMSIKYNFFITNIMTNVDHSFINSLNHSVKKSDLRIAINLKISVEST